MNQTNSAPPNYKRTTDKQYSLLKHKMAILAKQVKTSNNVGSYKKHYTYWEELTKSLNKLGPPYRTLQQWKKVWSDFRRAENRRKFKSNADCNKQYENEDINYNNDGEEDKEDIEYGYKTAPTNEIKKSVKIEKEDYDHNTQATFANEYDNEYSYPDEDIVDESYADDTDLFIPEETSRNSYNYTHPNIKELATPQQITFQHPENIQFSNPPPLQPSSDRLLDQTLYTLHNQMEHQSKLLDHLSQMSSTMSNLMERQVLAVEKQTEAIRRQALATEYHTRAMNNFIDMIREKMLKGNASQKAAATSTNLPNNIL